MAYTSAAIASSDITLLAADKPVLASIPSIASFSAGRWVGSATGVFTDPDITDTSYPVSNCVDGLTNVVTQTNTTGTSLALLFDFGAAGIEFDFVAFFNHDLYSDACTDLDIEIADDAAFSSNLIELASFNPSTLLSADRRFTRLDLRHTGSDPLRYSAVRYVRLQFTYGSAKAPALGEVAFGRRRQLKWRPNNEWDPDEEFGNVSRFESASGIKRDTLWYGGARRLNASYVFNATAQFTDILAWWAASGRQALPWLWIEDPNTAPNDVHLMVSTDPGKFSMPFVNWQARSFTIEGVEQGPHFLAEVTT